MTDDTRTGTPPGSRQVIVSGATGFVGQHLVPLFVEHGYEVIATAREADRARQFSWFERVRFVPLDFHKARPGIDFEPGAGLVHLAWPGLPNYKSPVHFEENLPHAYEFVKSLVLKGVQHVLVTGTCLEYGFQSGPIASSARPDPQNAYALAKDALRQYLEQLAQAHPFRLQWARLFYMYGKGQHPHALLSQLDRAIENGDAAFNMSKGEQLRDYLPIEEAARQLFDLYTSRPSGTYNICNGSPISVRRLVEQRIAQKQSAITPNFGYYPYPDYEPMAFWGIRDIGQTFFLPAVPNSPLASKQAGQAMGPMRLRYHPQLGLLENEAYDPALIDYSEGYQNAQVHSPRFLAHMKDMLALLKRTLPRGGKVVEVGCGKGDFVELMQRDGHFDARGFDAAYEGDNPAIERRYLTGADRIEADMVVLRHVLEHVPQPYQFLEMLSSIFGEAKVCIEVPSYDWILANKAFFDITYEHVNYFAQKTLLQLFAEGRAQGGLCFDGQYQYVLSDFPSLNPAFASLYQSREWEYPTFDALFPDAQQRIEKIERQLKGGSLFVWGAATKGCLFLSHCAARRRLVDKVPFAIDINPEKVGKFLPGSLVEIRDPQAFFDVARPGDVLLLPNPAYRAEIEQELARAKLGGIIIETL